MFYIPNIDNYLKILTDEEVENFIAIKFSEYFKSIEKNVQLNSADSCTHRYNVEILNIFDPELQMINTKSMIDYKNC